MTELVQSSLPHRFEANVERRQKLCDFTQIAVKDLAGFSPLINGRRGYPAVAGKGCLSLASAFIEERCKTS